jgi:hypothetical protein
MTELSAAPTEMDVLVRRLADESDIRALLARYARGMDRADFDLVRSCYHPGGTDAHGEYNGDVEGLVAYAIEFMGAHAVESMAHHICQATIDLDGDTAWVESYNLVLVRMGAANGSAPTDVVGPVRYVDLLERRNGEWRIARRKVVFEPHRVSTPDPIVPFAPDAFIGRMDRCDPSYDRRPESFLP